MNMAKKNILVTGAGGFAGRNISEYLGAKQDKYRVFAARHADLELLDEKAVKDFISGKKIDIVIHCANCGDYRKNAPGERDADAIAKNLRMFFDLARALPASARMINLGSGAEYDKRNLLHKVKEDDFDRDVPVDAYGFSKYVISKYIEKAKNIVCLRLFGLYGKYEDYRYTFISNAIVKNLLGMPIVINQNVLFDYLCINDLVRLVEKFIAHKPAHKHYNATPAEPIDLLSLARLVNMAGARKSEVRVLNPGLNREYTGGNARLLAEFPGFKFTPYAEGVKELYAYYSANLQKLDAAAVKADRYIKNCGTL